VLAFASALIGEPFVKAQNIVSATHSRPSISVLDTTREQDGLHGSVRRVKTDSAKIEFKEGRQVEGQLQLVELTTYGVKGNRLENVSYPNGDSPLVGREEYRYDDKGNIIEMTLKSEQGHILSREAYDYVFDGFGNWTKMVTSLLVFEDGQLKREPVEVIYRTLTYYYDDSIAKITGTKSTPRMPGAFVPSERGVEPVSDVTADLPALRVASAEVNTRTLESAGDPPLLSRRATSQTNSTTSSSVPDSPGPTAVFTAANPKPKNKDERVIREEARNQPSGVPVASTVSNSPATFEGKSAIDYYDAGVARLESGDVRPAIDNFLKSIQLETRAPSVYFSLGSAYLKINEDKKAMEALKKSVSLHAGNVEAHYGLGLSLFRLGRLREAVEAYKEAVKLDPNFLKAHYGLALAYLELKENTALMTEYRILAKLDKALAKKLEQAFPRPDFKCRVITLCL